MSINTVYVSNHHFSIKLFWHYHLYTVLSHDDTTITIKNRVYHNFVDQLNILGKDLVKIIMNRLLTSDSLSFCLNTLLVLLRGAGHKGLRPPSWLHFDKEMKTKVLFTNLYSDVTIPSMPFVKTQFRLKTRQFNQLQYWLSNWMHGTYVYPDSGLSEPCAAACLNCFLFLKVTLTC